MVDQIEQYIVDSAMSIFFMFSYIIPLTILFHLLINDCIFLSLMRKYCHYGKAHRRWEGTSSIKLNVIRHNKKHLLGKWNKLWNLLWLTKFLRDCGTSFLTLADYILFLGMMCIKFIIWGKWWGFALRVFQSHPIDLKISYFISVLLFVAKQWWTQRIARPITNTKICFQCCQRSHAKSVAFSLHVFIVVHIPT
jgi:hypothetical protein